MCVGRDGRCQLKFEQRRRCVLAVGRLPSGERSGVHLDGTAKVDLLLEAGKALVREPARSLGMSEHGSEAALAQLGGSLVKSVVDPAEGHLEQHPASTRGAVRDRLKLLLRQYRDGAWLQLAADLDVEIDPLAAELLLDLTHPVRQLWDLDELDVWRGDDRRRAGIGRQAGVFDGLVHRRRAVVDTRQQVAVQIDHNDSIWRPTSANSSRCRRTLSPRSVRTSTRPGEDAATRISSTDEARRCSRPASAATAARSTPDGVATWRSKSSLSACSATGRKSKIPPPPLLTHTMCRSAPAREAAIKPPMSCSSAISPISSQVGAPVASAAPAAEETTPSIPLAPRLDRKRSARGLWGKNVSTSRIAIEELTQTIAPSGRTGSTAQ